MKSPSTAVVAVLLGGGIESTSLVRRFLDAGRRVVPVHVACGLLWDAAEAWHVRRFCEANRAPGLEPLIEIDLPLHSFLHGHWAVSGVGVPQAGAAAAELEIPLRNLTLLGFAVHRLQRYANAALAIGTTADNSYADGSRDYFNRCEAVLSLEAGRPLEILTPYITWNKTRVIRETPAATLALSFSCVHPQGTQHCGTCIKCGRRRQAFETAGVSDPTEYIATG